MGNIGDFFFLTVVDIRDALAELKNALVDTEGIVVGTFKSFHNLKIFISLMNEVDLDSFSRFVRA